MNGNKNVLPVWESSSQSFPQSPSTGNRQEENRLRKWQRLNSNLGLEGRANCYFQRFARLAPVTKSCIFLASLAPWFNFSIGKLSFAFQGCPISAAASKLHRRCPRRRRVACVCLSPLQSIRGSTGFHGAWEKLELSFQEQDPQRGYQTEYLGPPGRL